MIVASQNVFHTKDKEIRKRADGFLRGHTRVGDSDLGGRAIRGRAQQSFGDRLADEILHLEILAVPIRQGRNEFGLNFQTGKDGSGEI